ncbi:hypothetical protein [Dellaglioa algida]|uniref:DNA-directed RNA polymerase beta subunit n=1 Tax=Dellaglioa algida TaxID=105612 RepID=A0A5C6M8X6_9LACO|nr:hypothetical protein [Dellaglioa algida]MDK1717489.1 hypothetical protein [Dellaglioa algida]MDK1720770.1 hypothetical protein [Dellaglioa algida]MDK1722439.1 hypothetical protein [Dellaglioa algida]MDK1724055.1 hypothetical protein [Dellaglioa algida]MDK1725644.1 hypothetical protein [Dellaglioa algida]
MTKETSDSNLINQFLKYDYHDRGMMKWQGFYLSDHTSARTKKSNEEKSKQALTHAIKMTSREIAEVINSAIMQSTPVSIDLSTKNIDGTLLEPVTGLIDGWYEDNLIINDAKVNIADIHAIYFSSY